jgi:hypothetical protein
MALITDASTSWSAGTLLTTDEVWQVRSGDILLATRASPSGDEGLYLPKNYMIQFNSGVTVKYRLAPNCTAAEIARESVSP